MGHVGKQTIVFKNQPVITCAYSTVGPKEAAGPLGEYFDNKLKDEELGQDSFEKSESEMIRQTIQSLLKKANKQPQDIQYLLAGDLQNQINATCVGVKGFNMPFLGLYGACSTMGESMSLGSMLVGGGLANCVIAGASSHFVTAERQFRTPMEYGGQRPLTQQWTVTGCGYVVISNAGVGPKIQSVTTGKIVDFDIKDVANMGAAMAPAAVDTIMMHLQDTQQSPSDYDYIVTGDLGKYGVNIAKDIANKLGVDLSKVLTDCGMMMFNDEDQDTHAGASGCGCSASIFSGFWYKQLLEKKCKKMLLVPTGALMSLCSSQQGESIAGIAHAVSISME